MVQDIGQGSISDFGFEFWGVPLLGFFAHGCLAVLASLLKDELLCDFVAECRVGHRPVSSFPPTPPTARTLEAGFQQVPRPDSQRCCRHRGDFSAIQGPAAAPSRQGLSLGLGGSSSALADVPMSALQTMPL